MTTTLGLYQAALLCSYNDEVSAIWMSAIKLIVNVIRTKFLDVSLSGKAVKGNEKIGAAAGVAEARSSHFP